LYLTDVAHDLVLQPSETADPFTVTQDAGTYLGRVA
jgi:hypothetical protein